MKKKLISKEQFRIENNVLIEKKRISKHFSFHWHDFFEIELIINGTGS